MMVQHVQTASAKIIPNNNSKYMKWEKNFGGDGYDYGIDQGDKFHDYNESH